MIENHISAISISHGYQKLLAKIIENGKPRLVRGFKTIELSPCFYSTSYPLRNRLYNNTRKLNESFAAAEFLFLMSGRNDLEMISFYNSKLKGFSDNGQILSGAYGPSIYGQLPYVVSSLKSDVGSRQAIINIWKPVPATSKDIPCTIAMHFLINSLDQLDLIVYMRSNDAWLGFPYDFFNFTSIQSYVAMLLKVDVGYYHHVASSMHLYERDIEHAIAASKDHTITASQMIESSQFVLDELNEILDYEKKLRNGADINNDNKNFSVGWLELSKMLDSKKKK